MTTGLEAKGAVGVIDVPVVLEALENHSGLSVTQSIAEGEPFFISCRRLSGVVARIKNVRRHPSLSSSPW